MLWYREAQLDVEPLKATPELQAAYENVRLAILHAGGPISANDHSMAGIIGRGVQAWRRIKPRLLELGKINQIGDRISAPFADAMLAQAAAKAEQNRRNAMNGWDGRR